MSALDTIFQIACDLHDQFEPKIQGIPERTRNLCNYFESKYNLRYIISGTTRRIYDLNDQFVIKIPNIEEHCITANLVEYLISKLIPGFPIANCDLYFFKGIPVVIMEKLDMKFSLYKYKRFASDTYANFNINDGIQAAKDSGGKLKIFDAGNETVVFSDHVKKIPQRYINHMLKKQPDIDIFLTGTSKLPKLKGCPSI